MRRTSVGDLLASFGLAMALSWVAIRLLYGSLPPLSYITPVPSAVLGVVELVLARRIRATIAHDPGAKLMTAIAIARCAALGKASALAGAAVSGFFVALLLRVVPSFGDFAAARHDSIVGAFGLAGSLLLLGAGLVLERSAFIPNEPRT